MPRRASAIKMPNTPSSTLQPSLVSQLDEERNRADQYLMHEIDQAWTHYRHLEEMRFKYLSLLIGLLGTSAAALIAAFQYLLKSPITLPVGVGLPALVLFLYGVTQMLLTAIIRIGYVLAAYEDIMYHTRAHFCGLDSYAFKVWSVRERISKPMKGTLFSL